ncbi:DUF1223 domain-containing protein [Dyella flava]|uniref:DUF1223 domain-containing protein n=2 Tax=Dyella flava TaxID=1920170 RepID=A0ABS2JZP0_9GAMM|nr:DUF1223 domain-containing protein [Dyella flava]MBM7124458.1 DUF1223 domain-containing protein [Dyella flava]
MANRRLYLRAILPALLALSIGTSVYAQDHSDTHEHPVVVELFQSQGCSSCPPAEENLNALADDPHVLALSFGVTYWDDLGWKDTFATQAYTDRQWRYAHYHRRDTVWTPQIYVNGHTDLVGDNRMELNEAIREAQSTGPSIAWLPTNRVEVKASNLDPRASDVWLVRYDPRTLHVHVGGGENGGRTLDQRNIVRELVHLGEWQGDDVAFSLPLASLSGLDTAVLVQAQDDGDILSASVQHAGDSELP